MELSNLDINDSDEVEFEIIQEDWNIYKLDDGTILKIRPIIMKIYITDQMTLEGKPLIGLNATNVLVTKVPTKLKKSTESGDATVSDERVNLNFEPIQEPWNSFKLEDDRILKVKLVVSRVVRTMKYNKLGEPIYIVSSSSVIDIFND